MNNIIVLIESMVRYTTGWGSGYITYTCPCRNFTKRLCTINPYSSNEELHQWMVAFDTAIREHKEKMLSRKSIRQQMNPVSIVNLANTIHFISSSTSSLSHNFLYILLLCYVLFSLSYAHLSSPFHSLSLSSLCFFCQCTIILPLFL